MASVSPLGSSAKEIWQRYTDPVHYIKLHDFAGKEAFAASLSPDLKNEISELRSSRGNLSKVDDSVLYAVKAARIAVERAGWEKGEDVGINIGSSRGATRLFEKFHSEFLKNGKAATLSSPATTLGNISSWVAQDLQSTGPDISHSVTCSTGLHAILNGVAWINAGMAGKFLAGGSEAALTPFTMAQMQAMKIIASEDGEYPCRALDLQKKKNTMVLGEGAAVACLEKGHHPDALAMITGLGYATEGVKNPVSISANGTAFQKSMKMALGSLPACEIDAIVMHAPGTLKGDQSEFNAIRSIFGEDLPALTSNKWKIGHTFGASGTLSLELAIMMLQYQEFIPVPYASSGSVPGKLHNILVNAVGFGGNAVSLLVSLPKKQHL